MGSKLALDGVNRKNLHDLCMTYIFIPESLVLEPLVPERFIHESFILVCFSMLSLICAFCRICRVA